MLMWGSEGDPIVLPVAQCGFICALPIPFLGGALGGVDAGASARGATKRQTSRMFANYRGLTNQQETTSAAQASVRDMTGQSLLGVLALLLAEDEDYGL